MSRRKSTVKVKPVANLARLKHYAQACVGSRVEIRSADGGFRKMRKSEASEMLNMFGDNELYWTLHIAVFKLNQREQIISMESVGYRVEGKVFQNELEEFVDDRCHEVRNGDLNKLVGWFAVASDSASVVEVTDEQAMKAYVGMHGYHA